MFNLSLAELLYRVAALLVVAGFHGFVVAAIARLLGDRGPQADQRLTINPIVHLELIGGLGLLFFQLGWIRPEDVDPEHLRGKRWGLIVVSLGALIATILLAMLLWRLRALIFVGSGTFVWGIVIGAIADMSVWFAICNLLLIPPLTGGYFLQAAAPTIYRWLLQRSLVVKLVLAALIVLGAARVLQPVHDLVSQALGFSS